MKWPFHQMELDPKDRHKTTFEWEGEKYQFRGAPFGMKHLTSRMQRLVQKTFRDCFDCTLVFVDDIIIMSNSFEEHVEHVQIVLQKLNEINLMNDI